MKSRTATSRYSLFGLGAGGVKHRHIDEVASEPHVVKLEALDLVCEKQTEQRAGVTLRTKAKDTEHTSRGQRDVVGGRFLDARLPVHVQAAPKHVHLALHGQHNQANTTGPNIGIPSATHLVWQLVLVFLDQLAVRQDAVVFSVFSPLLELSEGREGPV